ncbi:hypothetical protein EPUL_006076, partial [Erysiphe pulchra]
MHVDSSLAIVGSIVILASHVSAAASSPKGCFSSTFSLSLAGSQTFNSIGSCSTLCLGKKAEAMAMQDSDCYCGPTLPPINAITDDSKCSIPCPGYPSDLCGGVNAFSVYLTGLSAAVPNAESPSSTSASPIKPTMTTSLPPSVVTVGGETVVVTANPASTDNLPNSEKTKSSPNKAGIAAGVVVGLLAFAAIAGGLVLYLRNQKRRAIEEEHRQAAAVNSFIDGGKYSGTIPDTRLDPTVIASRRMSDGSIADNQDYSRRILK